MEYDLICQFLTELWLRGPFFRHKLTEEPNFNINEMSASKLQNKIILESEKYSDLAESRKIKTKLPLKTKVQKSRLKETWKKGLKENNQIFLLKNETGYPFVISDAFIGVECQVQFRNLNNHSIRLEEIIPITSSLALVWIKNYPARLLKNSLKINKNFVVINELIIISQINDVLSEYAKEGICCVSEKPIRDLLNRRLKLKKEHDDDKKAKLFTCHKI
jgi:hypothetical protein